MCRLAKAFKWGILKGGSDFTYSFFETASHLVDRHQHSARTARLERATLPKVTVLLNATTQRFVYRLFNLKSVHNNSAAAQFHL